MANVEDNGLAAENKMYDRLVYYIENSSYPEKVRRDEGGARILGMVCARMQVFNSECSQTCQTVRSLPYGRSQNYLT